MSLKKDHLKYITKENFESWIDDAFISYASCAGINGHTELGVNGFGEYTVRTREKGYTSSFFYKDIETAIEHYLREII